MTTSADHRNGIALSNWAASGARRRRQAASITGLIALGVFGCAAPIQGPDGSDKSGAESCTQACEACTITFGGSSSGPGVGGTQAAGWCILQDDDTFTCERGFHPPEMCSGASEYPPIEDPRAAYHGLGGHIDHNAWLTAAELTRAFPSLDLASEHESSALVVCRFDFPAPPEGGPIDSLTASIECWWAAEFESATSTEDVTALVRLELEIFAHEDRPFEFFPTGTAVVRHEGTVLGEVLLLTEVIATWHTVNFLGAALNLTFEEQWVVSRSAWQAFRESGGVAMTAPGQPDLVVLCDTVEGDCEALEGELVLSFPAGKASCAAQLAPFPMSPTLVAVPKDPPCY